MSSPVLAPNTEAAILARVMKAKDRMSREVAEYQLSIEFERTDIDRMNFLSERAREGILTPEETAELDSYLHVGSLLSILQSKARCFLNREFFFASVNQSWFSEFGNGQKIAANTATYPIHRNLLSSGCPDASARITASLCSSGSLATYESYVSRTAFLLTYRAIDHGIR